MTNVGKYSVLIAAVLASGLVSCSDDGLSLNPPASQSYPVEKEPVYSADSNAVFFVSVDTVHAERTAVLYAEADMPIRHRLGVGTGVAVHETASLNISPSAKRLVYVTSGTRHVCSMAVSPVCASTSREGGLVVSFLTDSSLIFSRNDSLFRADLAGIDLSYVGRGWEPSLSSREQVVYASLSGGSVYAVLRYEPGGAFDTLYIVPGAARPHWPTVDTTGNWLAYTVESGGNYAVHVVDLVQHIDRQVATTRYPRTCIVSQMLTLFTGSNGILYQVNYRGSTAIPWMYVDKG